jgi:hypothetical protein
MRPQEIVCSVYRNTVHKASSTVGTGTVVIPTAVLDGGDLADAIPPIGSSLRATCRSAQASAAAGVSAKFLTAEWRAIQAAQAPQYLFFCLQKSTKVVTTAKAPRDCRVDTKAWHAGDAPAPAGNTDAQGAGLRNYFYGRNTDSNAAITQFELEIQSSIGAYTYSGESTYPYLKTRQQLWRDVIKNTVDGYCSDEPDIWYKNNCCLLLHCSDWLRGITTPNCAFPIQINAKIRFENRREFIDGQCAAAQGMFGPAVMHDLIQGDPVMVMCYPNLSMTVSASSAAVSAANFSHQSGQAYLSQRQ